MAGHPTIDLLAGVPLFEDLSRANLGRIAALAEESSHDAGDPIVKRDDPGRAFHVIVDGRAHVLKGPIVNARRIADLGPGDFFGELALLDGEPRSATVVASTPLRTIRISRPAFRGLLREHPELGLKLLEGMARRMRALLEAPPL